MSTRTFLLSLVTITTIPLSAAVMPPAIEDSDLTAYFLRVLEGEEPSQYTNDAKLTWQDVGSARTRVWEAWKAANQNYDADLLPQLTPLADSLTHSWLLPAALEPTAKLPFFYGSKGDVRPTEGYPLFIYLHGSGAKEQEWSTGFKLCKRFADAPSAYFIPQIPNEGEYYRWWQKAKQYAWERLLRLAMISDDINPNQLYVFGISEGGYGSQRLASFYGDYWAGAGPMAGGEPLKNAPAENCFNLAFNLRTGAEDTGFYRNTLTGYVQQNFKKLHTAEPDYYNYNVELLPGYGHAIPYDDTTPWLIKQPQRNPYPKYVAWENFEMDGLKRHGFYNLWEEEDPLQGKSGRVYYTLRIKDNHIDLIVRKVTYTVMESQDGIDLRFTKSYTTLNAGKVRVYLNEQLIDPAQPVTITVNGHQGWSGMVEPTLTDMVNSVAGYYDSERIYPASVLIDLANPTAIGDIRLDADDSAQGSSLTYNLSGRIVPSDTSGVLITSSGSKILRK